MQRTHGGFLECTPHGVLRYGGTVHPHRHLVNTCIDDFVNLQRTPAHGSRGWPQRGQRRTD